MSLSFLVSSRERVRFMSKRYDDDYDLIAFANKSSLFFLSFFTLVIISPDVKFLNIEPTDKTHNRHFTKYRNGVELIIRK